MLKIMLVDDEFYFREALKVSLPWQELDFYICGEAKNGKDALEIVEKLSPDIIIMDINMPLMNGLEFVHIIREKYIDCKIIIITGHSEFNYAKQAVRLGVHNYILKPVNEEELTKTLLEVKNIIKFERKKQMEMDRLKRQVEDHLPILKEKFLNELLQGYFTKTETETLLKMEYLNINMYSDYYLVVTIELDNIDNHDWKGGEKQLWKFAVSNIATEIMAEKFTFDMCYDSDDRICFIIGASGRKHDYDFKKLLATKLDYIRMTVYKHLKFMVTIGVGSEKNSLFDLAASYKESIVALKNKLLGGSNRIILYETVEDSEIKANFLTIRHRNQLLMNMRIGNEIEVQNLTNQIFIQLREEIIHHEILYVICVEMVSVCLEFIAEKGLSFKNILPDKQLNIFEEIESKKSIEEIERWVKGFFRDTLEAVGKSKGSKASKVIVEVKKHIEENYHKYDLNIEEIAKSLFINYSHLCFIFKRDTGTTINKYLTEFRINKAKEHFDSGNIMVVDVANRVGYADANYFSKCFKKIYGLTPSSYLEST